jgi:hypothetical protein
MITFHSVLEVLGLIFLALAAVNIGASQRINFLPAGLFCWMLATVLR